MSEQEKRELKITISFSTSLKFWLAFFIVQIIASLVAIGIMIAIFSWIASILKGIVPFTHVVLHNPLCML